MGLLHCTKLRHTSPRKMAAPCRTVLRSVTNFTSAALFRSTKPRYSTRYLATTATETSKTEDAEADKSETPAEGEMSQADKKLTEEKAKLDKELKEYKDKYVRALAETENVRQRMKQQLADAKLYGIQSFCKDLLEVADVLQKATETVPAEEMKNNPTLKTLFEGLKMTETQMQKVFSRNGLEMLNPVGEKFDPNFHEALFMAPMEGKEPGTVAVVSKVGYTLHNRVVRPALVGVVKAP
ncbi:GRPEL1 [Branchiostoma lanceolatum]|uniref:GrpE protein homolog n=1 Tax=Branchiostoma lanceolatum TaxID=7740 RepID=A0A8J9ZNC2_BRALA|nr:GRPEL1 [Branchiostoma lanceolatum]